MLINDEGVVHFQLRTPLLRSCNLQPVLALSWFLLCFISGVHEKAVEGVQATDEAVHEHPYRASGIAFGVGTLIGYLVARRLRPQRRLITPWNGLVGGQFEISFGVTADWLLPWRVRRLDP